MQASRISKLLLAAVTLVMSACSSAPPENHEIGLMLTQEVPSLDQSLASRIMAEPVSLHSKSRVKVEGEINRRVWWWLRYYTVRDRERFKRILERGETYRPLVQQILRQHQLPTELYYLAMIESGYVTHATSTTSAVGIWQFMRPTALHYGLGVDASLDDRRHPIAATQAAAQYLADLHKEFNSWYLAIAAYNCGQGRIRRAIREGHSHDFWFLAERGYLPQETMDYIPKFLAAATVGFHLEEFGFNQYHPLQQWPEVVAVELQPGARLSHVAKQANMSEKELLRLNPRLRQALAHPSRHRVKIWMPTKAAEKFVTPKAALARN
jgi:membrane-bound lytic murein transglycosylase D